MIDVGNDREFGFLYEPPADLLDRTFAAVFGSEMDAESRRQAIQLARFFLVPGRTASPSIQMALLQALDDPDASVRDAAAGAVGELSLRGVSSNPELLAEVVRRLRGTEASALAVVRALVRQPDLLAEPEVLAALKARLPGESAARILRPVLDRPEFTDAEVLDILTRGWERVREPTERLALIEVLLARRSLIDVEEPSEAVKDLLRAAVHDPSALVRERTLSALQRLERLWSGRASALLVLSALADDTPAIRRLGLGLAGTRPRFWERPDARESLLRLLVDPDGRVRETALTVVEVDAMLKTSPEIARRIKALTADPTLKARAEAALRAGGFEPAEIEADVALARPRLLSLATFREKVNPIFYRLGDDGYSCARCHANHSILRIAEADPARGFTDEQVMINYNSALKVVNLGHPESSLILRKPRSPQGQGEADPSSPTGLTHVGGPRWEDTEHPSYQAILSWLREATDAAHALPADLHLEADGYAPDHPPRSAGDGDLGTFWITENVGARPDYPHELTLDLGSVRRVDALLYVPRQDRSEGRVKDFVITLSIDGRTWSEPVARGQWPDDPAFQFVALPGRPARYVRLGGRSEVGGRPFMAVAELTVDAPVASHPEAAASREAEEGP